MLIAYRDYIQEGNPFDLVEGFAPSMPASNLTTPQLAMKARTDPLGPPGNIQLQATFSENKPIGLVAILAHNMDASVSSFLELQTFNGASWDPVFNITTTPWNPPASSQFNRHHIIVLPYEVQARRIIYTNLATSTTDGEAWTAGRWWAGPVWRPQGKTAQRDFRMRTMDETVVHRSIAQQIYADYRPRYRQLTCSIPYLLETEAIGNEEGTEQNLQDIAFEVGQDSPIIVVPSQDSEQLIHKFGLYGHFFAPPSIDLMDANAELGRLFTTAFDVVEAM